MPLKIFSKITETLKDSLKASDLIDDIADKAQDSKADLLEKVDLVFRAGAAGAVEGVNRLTHEGGVQATIYETYGYMQDGRWIIPMRGRVHQNRILSAELLAGPTAKLIRCDGHNLGNLKSRVQDFTDDSRSGQVVVIQFDRDPEAKTYTFPRSDLNGLIELNIELSEERARGLLDAQGASQWLTFKVVSDDHSGAGQVRLIEPAGLSVISDIDDTIKVTIVPGDKDAVLRRTLCEDFQHVPEMAQKFRDVWGNAAFHYVSGGPWQLYRSLYDFLIKGAGGFPAGSFHLNYYPKNFLAEDTREILIDSITGSLGRTFDHKVEQIRRLMTKFAGRRFILVGDSGEVDPEVYRHIKGEFQEQVQEIWIRDVLNDAEVNSYRLDGMNVIKVDPVVCATDHHYQKLSMRFQEFYDRPYNKNTSAPCG
jgi:hypothetical protein